MSEEQNVAIARRFFAEQDRGKGVLAEGLSDPGYMAYIPGFPPMDRAAHTDLGKAFYGAFSDLKQTIDDGFGNDDRAVLRFTITGTHDGELMGMAPTGKPISVSGLATFRIVGGKVRELHEVFDQMGMMQQIGAIPAH
jgi:hypothetical protein